VRVRRLLITIDGPAGAGKTTVSRRLADHLGYTYVDTGALYRGVALAAAEAGIDPIDDDGLERLCAGLELRFVPSTDGSRLMAGKRDITDRIRTPEISMLASAVSARPVVRRYLLSLQRDLGRQKGVVFEGRDMGTVVFPEADVKFYLDAVADVRASRRYQELKRDPRVTLEEVARDLGQRDRNDSSRAVAPLKAAADAVRIDSSRLPVEEVVRRMTAEVMRRAEVSNAGRGNRAPVGHG
jgi:cytidylate kinase